MKKLRNPFLLTGYYSREYFCNREQELEMLKDHLKNERNVVIYSWRRIGKTALIKCFLTLVEKEKQAEAVYVDLLGTRDMATALKQITQAVFDRFGRTISGIPDALQKLLGRTGVELSFDPVTGIPRFSVGLRDREYTENSLEAIGTYLQSRKKQVLFILDEFQQITHYKDLSGEAIFRSWAQSFPGIRFMFSGSHRAMMVSMFTEKNRPFYRSTQLMQLDPIDFDAYGSFIKGHFEHNHKSFDEEAARAIYVWSRKQTYCIQLACNKIFSMYDSMRLEYLQEVYKDILDQESPVFSGYTKLLTNLQWDVMLAIAKEEPLSNPLSKGFINKYFLGAASSVNTALKMLQKNELVIEDDGKYYVHDVLLARWLQSL